MRVVDREEKTDKMEGRLIEIQRRLYEARNKLRRVEEEIERLKKEGERKEKEWKMQQMKWRRDKKAMEDRLSRQEVKMGGEERKEVEGMEFGDWSEWEEDWKSVDLSEEEDKVAQGRKRLRRLRSEVSRASDGTKRSRSGERRRHSSRQNEHRSSGKRMEMGGDVIERHRNKVIMIRKGRNWKEDYGVAEWVQTELGEKLDIQITKTNDRQVYKILCEGEGTKERIWEAKKKWEEERAATLEKWRSIAERRVRAKIFEGMKEISRKAGFKDARIVINENGWRDGEMNERRERSRREWEKEKDE